ncbi:pentapeptide repeat-containing protein [Streptomyces noursei]|uniref:pentapeptide repeat-containing protein n=1 Tax=Streptomyces noursei TaxID=1971 RepID=UPI0030F1F24B
MRSLETHTAEAQGALTRLGGLGQERNPGSLNVGFAYLRRADGDGLWLNGVDLDGTCLEAANVYQVNLSGASLTEADMRHAELPDLHCAFGTLLCPTAVGRRHVGVIQPA